LQKIHVENFSPKTDKNFDVSFSSTFFVLSHFRVFLSDGISKTPEKTCYKKIVWKSFYKKINNKNPKPICSRVFYHVFERFSVQGIKKILKKSDPGPFFASDLPTHHGGHRFSFAGPFGCAKA
jgi:hypothetical protein